MAKWTVISVAFCGVFGHDVIGGCEAIGCAYSRREAECQSRGLCEQSRADLFSTRLTILRTPSAMEGPMGVRNSLRINPLGGGGVDVCAHIANSQAPPTRCSPLLPRATGRKPQCKAARTFAASVSAENVRPDLGSMSGAGFVSGSRTRSAVVMGSRLSWVYP